MYRTGDRCRWRSDGTLEFPGRLDNQIKIRGFRVELGEIETKLLDHHDLREAAVLYREDQPGEKRLVAYFTSKAHVSAEALREHLGARVPDHMIPAAYVRLESLPLTVSRKSDRRSGNCCRIRRRS